VTEKRLPRHSVSRNDKKGVFLALGKLPFWFYNRKVKTHSIITIKTLEDLHAFAARLKQYLALPAILALTGDLGSGKTAFTQQLAEAYGINELLPSPTFTLSNVYKQHDLLFVHADLYRLMDTDEITLLGLSDYFAEPNTVTVVEWADRLTALFPPQTIWLHLTLLEDNSRLLTVKSANKEFWWRFESKSGELSR